MFPFAGRPSIVPLYAMLLASVSLPLMLRWRNSGDDEIQTWLVFVSTARTGE